MFLESAIIIAQKTLIAVRICMTKLQLLVGSMKFFSFISTQTVFISSAIIHQLSVRRRRLTVRSRRLAAVNRQSVLSHRLPVSGRAKVGNVVSQTGALSHYSRGWSRSNPAIGARQSQRSESFKASGRNQSGPSNGRSQSEPVGASSRNQTASDKN